MFVIKLPVPLALLLASGEMPVVSIKWQHKAPPCRVLIYAEEMKEPISSYPVEWQMIAHNAQVFGNIPHYVDQPVNAIVGWVDIAQNGVIPKVWNYGEKLYRAFNAHTLDKPVFCKVKQDGIDLRFSPDDFIAHRKKLFHIFNLGTTLFVPVNARIWEQSAHRSLIVIDLIGEAAKCLITEADTVREYDSVIISYNGMFREFEFSSRNSISPSFDEKGKLKMYHSVLRGGKKTAKTSVVLYLDEELNT